MAQLTISFGIDFESRSNNNQSLYGMWIDLTTFETYREFIEFCNRLHADEQDAELMFQDYEHFPSHWLQCCIDYSAVCAFYGVPDGR